MKIMIIAKHLLQGLGGIEIQCDLIARYLAKAGHQVIYVSTDPNIDQPEKNYHLCGCDLHAPQALKQLIVTHQPDVIYLRNNKHQLRHISRCAYESGTPLVFAASSLQDFQPWSYHHTNASWTPRRLASVTWQRIKSRWNWRGLRHVAGAVSLNPAYTALLPVANKRHIFDAMECEAEPFEWPRPFVAWVAQLKDYKHPEDFVALAHACSDQDIDFLMVGGLSHQHYQWITEHKETPSRFHYLGPMTPEQVNGFLAASMLMVHTCDPEGFGNNFIQAWLQGKPTLSLRFDPGNIIRQQQLGEMPGTLEGLASALRKYTSEPTLLKETGERARIYANTHFDPATNVQTLERFLLEVAGKGEVA